MKKPVIFYSGNTVVRAGNIVGIRGEYLDQDWTAVISDGVRKETIDLIQQNRQSFKIQVPADFEEGIYTLELLGSQPLRIALNTPKVRWMQGDEGESTTPDGWVRLQGECLRIHDKAMPHMMLKAPDGTKIILYPERIYDDYSVGFVIPGLQPALYQATYWNGYASCECGILTVAPSPEAVWRKTVYNVTEYGLSNRSVQDCTEALNKLLAKAEAEGGGVLYFPRGRYHLTGCFHIPAGVILRGDGYRYTQLFWTDEWRGTGTPENPKGGGWYPAQLPEVMITADGNFAIEDLEFAGGRVGRLLRAGSAKNPAKNVRIENVRVSINAFSGINGRHSQERYCAVLKETWHLWDGEEHDMLGIHGSNVKIRNCKFDWSGRLMSYGYQMEYLLMQNLEIGNVGAVRYWMPIGDLDKAIIEDCDINGWDVGCGGDNIYMARIQIRNTICGDREAFTTDIASGIEYHNTAAILDGCHFAFPDNVDLSRVKAGSKLCILSGTGAGQFRRVTGIEGQIVTIESPFDVQPDEHSHMTINRMFTNWYFKDFTIDNCGMLQFYVAQGNTVVDGVKTTRSTGIKGYGQFTYKGIQNNWYNSYINNELTEGNCYHRNGWFDYHDNFPGELTAHRLPGYSFLYITGRAGELIHLCCTVRGNILRDNCMIYIRSAKEGSVSDLIVDSNYSADSFCGIYVEGKPERMLLSGNACEQVEEAVHYEESRGVHPSQDW